MPEYKSNFALLMDLLEISGPEMAAALQVDRVHISRWRGGVRRLMPGRKWAEKIISVFMERDAALNRPIIAALLAEIYPVGEFSGSALREQLADWLTAPHQNKPDRIERRLALYAKLIVRRTDKKAVHEEQNRQNKEEASEFSGIPSRTATGINETREALASVFDYMASLSEPARAIFVCPDGLDIITRDEEYCQIILTKLTATLQKGHTLDVVLRTDFRMSDVAAFSGPWLTAHLMGYIKSWYYDDFRQVETDKMIFLVSGRLAVRARGDGSHCEIFTDADAVAKIEQEALEYQKRSAQRFHYHFFEKPEDFLLNIDGLTEMPAYLFGRLPHFAIGGSGLLSRIGLSEEESVHIIKQFGPLLISPDNFSSSFCHMLCMDAIEEALDKPKHMNFAFQSMLGRRSYMFTQTLVDQLSEIRRLMSECENYQVCFMDNGTFDKIAMEIGAWGNMAAIGWLPGKQSTATKNSINAATLHGYCGTIWDRIPNSLKSDATAHRVLNKLLSRAKNFGYAVK